MRKESINWIQQSTLRSLENDIFAFPKSFLNILCCIYKTCFVVVSELLIELQAVIKAFRAILIRETDQFLQN